MSFDYGQDHFREQIGGTPHTWVECANAPFYQNTPFYPIADMLQQSLRWDRNQSAEQRLTALEASLELAGLKLAEAVPLIAPLLNLAVLEPYPPRRMAPISSAGGCSRQSSPGS